MLGGRDFAYGPGPLSARLTMSGGALEVLENGPLAKAAPTTDGRCNEGLLPHVNSARAKFVVLLTRRVMKNI